MVAVFNVERWMKVYPCLHPTEIVSLVALDILRGIGTFLAPQELADVAFQVAGLKHPVQRFEAFCAAYGVSEITWVTEDGELNFYLLDQTNFATFREYINEYGIIPSSPCRTFAGIWGV